MRGLAEAGMTMVVVTHEVGFARDVADTVVFMDGGRILEQGAPVESFVTPPHERTRSCLHLVRDDGGEDAPSAARPAV